MKGYLHIVDLHVYQQSVATIIQKIGGLCRTKTRRGNSAIVICLPSLPAQIQNDGHSSKFHPFTKT